jgi:hypothetical protein
MNVEIASFLAFIDRKLCKASLRLPGGRRTGFAPGERALQLEFHEVTSDEMNVG